MSLRLVGRSVHFRIHPVVQSSKKQAWYVSVCKQILWLDLWMCVSDRKDWCTWFESSPEHSACVFCVIQCSADPLWHVYSLFAVIQQSHCNTSLSWLHWSSSFLGFHSDLNKREISQSQPRLKPSPGNTVQTGPVRVPRKVKITCTRTIYDVERRGAGSMAEGGDQSLFMC